MGKAKKTQGKIILKPGPRVTHGGYSFIRTGSLPKSKAKIERYLTWVRQSYIEDISGIEENMTAGQTILLNKLVMLEGLCRCIETYQAKTENLDMPDKYLSYLNNIIKICSLLGIKGRKPKDGPNLADYIAEKYPEKKGKNK